MLRVALVSPYSLAVPGGVQNHVLSLVPALGDLGVDATVLAPCDGVDAAGFGVPVVSLGRSLPVPANGSTARIGLNPAGVYRLRRALGDFDVVHVHEPLVPGVGLAAAWQKRLPSVGTFHAASDGGYWPYRAFNSLLGVAWRRLNVRTAVSEAALERVRPYFDGPVEIVPNGFDAARFADAVALPERANAPGPVLLFLGRDEPRKGLDVMRHAFRRVRAVAGDVSLWLAGPGTERVDDPGTLAFGGVDDATLASLYVSADIFCAPARFGESFGIVLLEAMAAGAAVVASAIDGYAAVARDGAEALLVTPGDDAALGDAIVRMLADPGLRERLTAAGRARAGEFDWRALAPRVAALYEQALATGTRS